MFDQSLKDLRSALERIVKELDPEVLESTAAVGLVKEFTAIEHVAAAGKALAAKRVADSGAWKKSGARTAAHWMAHTTGTSVGSALGVLETAARLSELPKTEHAVRAGKLSEAQAKEIASAAAAAPSCEGELLKVAKTEGMATLKERCARVRAAATADERDRYARIHNRRRLRHWTDPEGAFRLEALLTPDSGARVLAALEPFRERIFREARKQGRKEPYEAYGADALVELAQAAGSGHNKPGADKPRALVHVFVDHAALMRGHTRDGEVCELAGVGPIPVATAEALSADAYLRVLVTDGTDVTAVSTLGSSIPTRVKTAVCARDTKCVVPGCEVRHHLHIDHIQERHEGDRTELANLQRVCPYHHYLKTYKGYRTAGPPGARTWHPPGEGPTSNNGAARGP